MSSGVSIGNGSQSPPNYSKLAKAAVQTSETHDDCLRFSYLTLDELSEELERRTKETQKLQDGVENATTLTLERFACTGICSTPAQSCHNRRFNVYDPRADCAVFSTNQQAVTQPIVCVVDNLNQGVAQRDVSSPDGEFFVKYDCLQQLSDLQLNKTHHQPKQETFSLDHTIMNLQTELHEVQNERDILSDLSLKDSKERSGVEMVLCMLEELQSIVKARNPKLDETEDEPLALKRRVEKPEQNVKEMFLSPLSQETQCEDIPISSPHATTCLGPLSPASELTEDFKDETDRLQRLLSVENLGSEEYSGYEQRERMEGLIAYLGQEMALLTDKLSSSKNNSASLSGKLQLLKKLAGQQTSVHQSQICCLEQELIQAQSQLTDTQREKEQCLNLAKELQSQLEQFKRCGKQKQCELQEEVRALRGELEALREQLRRRGVEKTSLQTLLEQGSQEGRKSLELLEEKNKEVHMQQETQQHFARLEEAQRQYQSLYADKETLRLKLDEREKMVDILRLQVESSTQTTVQQGRNINSLYQENSLLSNQLNQHKLDVQLLRTELDQHKQQLQASVAEHSQRVNEERLKKQQLDTQLELQRVELLTLKTEHRQLQNLHSCKEEKHEGVVAKLQSQLRNAHSELDQVRSTLRTLDGADGRASGLQAAMDMQEKITARREQIDSLQGKIQHLEATMERLYQEKQHQNLEQQRQLKELTIIREEKRQLGKELEALCSKDEQLRSRMSQLEAILHKVSESFADCQDFIQLQEQEFFRLKLQHALDLKELQGQHLYTALNVPPPYLGPPSALAGLPSSKRASNAQIPPKRQQDSPTRELRSLVKELQAVISENHRPHTDNSAAGSSFHRLHSPRVRPEPRRVHRTTLEPHFLKMAELDQETINKSFSDSPFLSRPVTAARYTSSPQLLSLGRRSPVYSLLTSDPNCQQQPTDLPRPEASSSYQ